MTQLLQLIKADHLEARLKNIEPNKTLLTTLIGEVETLSYNLATGQELKDEDVIKVITKFVKNNNESYSLTNSNIYKQENDILEKYLPKQLSQSEIENTINTILANNANAQMKDIMAYFKTNLSGQYDGKLVSTIIKSILNA